MRKAPRWTIAFLRALERTGEARAAAEDAGVDHTTAYQRRRAHAEFAADWAAALERGRAERERVRAAELAGRVEWLRRAPSTIATSGNGPPPRSGEELTIVNGKLRRVGPGRWSKAKEQALLAELAWSGSISRGCRAAGVSTQALSRRRFNDRHLDAACDAAVGIARKRLNGYVVEAANRTFDPDELPLGEGGPTVTIDQAIAILKLGAGRGAAPAAAPVYEPYEPADVMKRLEQKMRMLGLPREEGEGAADRG